MDMDDFEVLWVWGFCGDSHRFFCGYEMSMGIEIQSPRQPDAPRQTRRVLSDSSNCKKPILL